MSHKRIRSSKISAKSPIWVHDDEAKERFDSIFKTPPMFLDKGLKLGNTDNTVIPLSIRKIVVAFKWKIFCEVRPHPNEKLVQKFYANLISIDASEILVHKNNVPLTSESINDFLQLPSDEEDDYSMMLKNVN
ncbi:hypothetical protein ES288_A10G133000v1 [Gossypium darwinii]|uniref:Uncharacterized protein n=1 Tax=Gossypium darwinii TaxID=34276 RepID=A0A5D2EYU4_GOSDA|nr:hypothetical protein ES288_A10G133000v1 [Gossypium darwinii]